MTAPRSPATPAVARWLLRLLVDRRAWEVVAGDLEEEFREVAASSGVRAARRRFWRQTLGSIPSRWRGAGRHRPRRPAAQTLVTTWWQDLRYGLRQFRREPTVPLAAAVTLALGIAATTTIFGMLHALVLRPLPYADPSRVAFVLGRSVSTGDLLFNMSYADVVDLRSLDAFEDIAVYRPQSANLSGSGLPERVQAYRVSPNTFRLLGVGAEIGRTFTETDLDLEGDRLAVLSHGLWIRRYGGDRSVVGRTVRLNGEDHLVVGVMPRSFEYPVFNYKGDLWTPLVTTPEWTPAARDEAPSVVVVARLAPGVTLESARTATDGLMRRLALEHPASNDDRGAQVTPMGSLGREQSTPAFGLLAVASLLVLLVACANVANLLIGRSAARGRELAVRAALGAGRGRLVRQLLAESVVMAAAGGVLGGLLTWWALEALRRAMPEFVLRVLPGVDGLRADGTALVFAAGMSLATVLIFGLLPAWQSTGVSATEALRSGARLSPGSRRRWLRQSLVVAEVAMSVALVVTSVLLGRSAAKLLAADPGFDKAQVLGLSVSLPEAGYPSRSEREAFYARLTDRLEAHPGIEAVGLVNTLPFSTSDASLDVEVLGREDSPGRLSTVGFRLITPGYFTAMGMSVTRGRTFDTDDGRDDRQVVLVNETFARRHFAAGDPVGHSLRLPDFGADSPPFTIVGEVSDVRHLSLDLPAEPEVYLPYAAVPRATMSLAVRAVGDPSALTDTVRSLLADLDPTLAAYDVAPLGRLVENSFIPQTLAASMLWVFGTGALVLAAVGLYGVLAFTVGQRTREIGIRVALGARTGEVARLVVGQSLRLVLIGLGLGLVVAWGGGRALSSLLFGVEAADPFSYAATVAVLLTVGIAASLAPVRRALRVDPVVALRVE